ncbi:MAG: translation initiation factor IF-2 [Candidatus Micrarchaeaceae archaeon]
MIRQPIICVMGHVDHGKTTLLDRIRNSAIAAKEAGGITQHIGASEVPIDVVNKICGPIMSKSSAKMIIPGLLFIDTPGHEAFTNLRQRGGSVADLAILVIDITKGFEPQTVEAIEILKQYKTPFIVAANKVDLIAGWIVSGSMSIGEALKRQNSKVLSSLDERIFYFIGKLSEYGFSSERYDRVSDFTKELAIIPISAKSGEGIAELLMLVAGLAQKYMEAKLKIEVGGAGRGSILEKKEVKGLGTTIDVILYDGSLKVNDTIAFATPDGVITTKIRAMLKPKPLHEIRESTSKFYYVERVDAASGVKISATSLENALPGSPVVQVISGEDYTKEINAEMKEVFKTDKVGVVIKADTIGSVEAISMLLGAEGMKVSKKGIGNVNRRDVIDAFAMNSVDRLYAVVLAFNVDIEQDAKVFADSSGIKIIKNNIIYGIVDEYKEFVQAQRRESLAEIERRITFPGCISVLPNSCFRASHPAIFGVEVLDGRIKPGYVMMTENGVVVGRLRGIQNEKNQLDVAKKGDAVAVSMDEPTFGRQIKEGQTLYTRITDAEEKLLAGEYSSMLTDDEKKLLHIIIDIKNRYREQL